MSMAKDLRLGVVALEGHGLPVVTLDLQYKPVVWIHGMNGAGKGFFFESLRAALMGRVWSDAKSGFISAKSGNSGVLADTFCFKNDPFEMVVDTRILGAPGRSKFSVTPREGKSPQVSRSGEAVPGDRDIHADMHDLCKRQGRLFNEGMAGFVLTGVDESLLLEVLPAGYHERWKEASRKLRSTPAQKLDGIIDDAAGRIKRHKAQVANLEATKATGCAPVNDAEYQMLRASVSQTQNQLASAKAWISYNAAMAEQQALADSIAQGSAQLAAAEAKYAEATAAHTGRIQRLTLSLEALDAYLARMQDIDCKIEQCPTCWQGVGKENLDLVREATHAALVKAIGDRDADASAAELGAWITSAKEWLGGQRCKVRTPFAPTGEDSGKTVDELAAELDSIQTTYQDMQQQKARWDAEQDRRDNLLTEQTALADFTAYHAALLEVRTKVVTSLKASFVRRVSELLPASMGESAYLDNENAEVGVIRDSVLISKLSGGEQAILMGCFAIAAGERLPVCPPVFMPDVNLHPQLAMEAATLWASYPGTVLIQSAFGPEFPRLLTQPPAETTCLLDANQLLHIHDISEVYDVEAPLQVVAASPQPAAAAQAPAPATAPAPKKKSTRKKKSAEVETVRWVDINAQEGLKHLHIGTKVMVNKTTVLPGGSEASVDLEGIVKTFRRGQIFVQVLNRKLTFDRNGLAAGVNESIRLTHWSDETSETARAKAINDLRQYMRIGPEGDQLFEVCPTGELVAWAEQLMTQDQFELTFGYRKDPAPAAAPAVDPALPAAPPAPVAPPLPVG